MSDTGKAKCVICGEPMIGPERVFRYHGFSGPCPKPPLSASPPPPVGKWMEDKDLVHYANGGWTMDEHQIASMASELLELRARIRSLSQHNPDSPKPLSDEDAFDIQPKDRADG